MRTDKEKMDFAKACLMIEKKGGNVQKYIALNWPSYTPRATWYNIQRVYLGRSTNELTEGRPNIEKGDEEMRKQKNSQDETAKGLLDWVRKGRNPATYLAGEGFASPATALRNIKDYARKHYSPEIVEEICRITLRGTKTAPAEPETSENPPEEVKAPETVDFNGKEYERMTPSPTCCQPAIPSGVTVPDEVLESRAVRLLAEDLKRMQEGEAKFNALPDEEKKAFVGSILGQLQVCGVMGSYGRFEQNIELKGERYMTFVMHMQLTGEDIRITFSADQWKTMLKEIPIALRQLGLSK